MFTLKKSILFSCLSTFIWAETVTLTPIDIQGEDLNTGIVVLSEDEAKETNTITLQERLERDVSFSVVSNLNGEESLSFRGLDFKATAYVEDGIPLYRSANGYVDTKLGMTDAELRLNDGSGTASLGVSPMGGEVQIDSKNPTKTFEGKFNTSISNNDEYYHTYAGSMVKNVYIKADAGYYHQSDYRLSDNYSPTPLQEKGKRLNSDKDQKYISLKSGVFIDDQFHLAAKVSVTRAEYGIPPNVYTDLLSPVFNAYSRIDRKDLNSYYLYADYDREDLEITVRAYYDDYEDLYKIYNDPAYRSNWPEVTYNDHRLGTVIKGVKTHGDHKSTFIVRAEENEHFRSGGGMESATYTADTFNMGFLHHWKIGSRWEIEGGLSYTLLQAKEAADASAVDPTEDKTTFDAQVKVTYSDEKSVLYGSIADKSRMPAMSEMFTFFPWENANPNLKPETSLQYSAGCQYALEEKTFIDLSLYYYDISDLIIYRNNGYINREEAEHYGAEMRLNSTYFDQNRLRISYAYAYTQDSEGEALAYIPRHQLKIEDTVSLTPKLDAYLGYQYMGNRSSPNSATYSDEQMDLKAYHLLDTQFSYMLTPSINGRAGIKNILDESYEWRYGYPARGRSYYLSLTWKL